MLENMVFDTFECVWMYFGHLEVISLIKKYVRSLQKYEKHRKYQILLQPILER